MAEKVEIKATFTGADGIVRSAKQISEELKRITAEMKMHELGYKNGTLASKDFISATQKLAKEVNSLNAPLDKTVNLYRSIWQMQNRAENGFTSLSTSLATMDKKMNTANQTLISLSQGMQDSAQFSMGLQQGMRGVANNIQQVSQMFALLYKETGSAKGAFGLMISQLNSPAGLLVGLAAVTSAIQIIPSLLKDAGSTSKEVFEQMAQDAQKLSKFGFGYSSAQSIDVAKATIKAQMSGMTRTIGGTSGEVGDIARVEVRAGSQADYSRLEKELQTLEEFEKKNAEVLKQERERAALHGIINKYTNGALDIVNQLDEDGKKKKKKLQEAGIYGADSSYLFQSRFGDVDSSGLDGGGLSPFQRSFMYGGGFNNDNKKSKAYTRRQNFLAQMRNDNAKDRGEDSELQDKAKMYDNLFFNPMKDGFNDLNSVIRNELFGSLDEMKNKFGVLGASIIQALNSVIAKLLETAIMASIVSIATGGSTSFIGAFTSIASGTASAGSMIMGSNRMANQMVMGGGAQVIQIVGESRIKDDHILIQYKRANSVRKAVRA